MICYVIIQIGQTDMPFFQLLCETPGRYLTRTCSCCLEIYNKRNNKETMALLIQR